MTADWRLDAACIEVGPDLFFPEAGGIAADAKRVCAGCTVRVPCLEFALAHRIPDGVFGGLSDGERRRVRRQRRLSVDQERSAA